MSEHRAEVPERDHSEQSFAVQCTRCHAWTERRIGAPGSPLPNAATCGECGTPQPLDFAGHVAADGKLDGCPRCDYHTLCIQKDFNNKLGVLVVAVTYAILFFSGLPIPWLVAALVVFTVVDVLLLRLFIKRVLICYRCKAQYRGFVPGDMCRTFDLATWEVHDDVPGG